jgi:type II secretion system protein N
MKRWLLSTFGYLAYTMAILVFLLWWRFPAAEVASWCENRLQARYPSLTWRIDSLAWAFPNRFVFKGVRAHARGKTNEEVIEVKALELTLDPTSLLRKNRRISYQMRLYGGIGTGRIHVNGERDLSCQGRFVDLNLKEMRGLATSLKRSIQGRAGATYSWQVSWPDLKTREVSGMVTMENGLLPLRKPVLGLKALDFSRLEASVMHRDRDWLVDKGVLEAKTMHVSFKGKIVPGPDLGRFRINISGSLTPRSELFKTAGNREMATVIRGFLRKGALPFTVSGIAAQPAVQFPGGLSAAMRRFQSRGGRP